MLPTSPPFYRNVYIGPIYISPELFTHTPGVVPKAVIATQSIFLQPVRDSFTPSLTTLLTNNGMAAEKAAAKIATLIQRWKDGDCFSGFCVFDRTTKVNCGYAILDHGKELGQATYTIIVSPDYQGTNVAVEISAAMLTVWANEVRNRHIPVNKGTPLEGRLETISSIARINGYAYRLLTLFQFTAVATSTRWRVYENPLAILEAHRTFQANVIDLALLRICLTIDCPDNSIADLRQLLSPVLEKKQLD